MTNWVKFQNGQILEGPVAGDRPSGDFVEYVEVVNLPPAHGPITVTLALTGGKCVKTITAQTWYAAERQAAYPPIGDQLDDFWHAMDNNLIPRIEPFYSQIKAVKDEYPKPPQ
jgi:hypothetical protein